MTYQFMKDNNNFSIACENSGKTVIYNDKYVNFQKDVFLNCLGDEKDIGLNDAFLYGCIAYLFKDNHNIKYRLPCYYPDTGFDIGYDENEEEIKDYFDKQNRSIDEFIKYLDFEGEDAGLAIVPTNIKGHYATLFIDLSNKQMLYLFDSGLVYCSGEQIITGCEQNNYEILAMKEPVNICEDIFGNEIGRQMICLNNYCLQTDESCGYWAICSCLLAGEINDFEQIKRECKSGIFQIKLAKKVFDMTDVIIEESLKDAMLIKDHKDEEIGGNYNYFALNGHHIYIQKDIKSETVDFGLLQQFIKYKINAEYKQKNGAEEASAKELDKMYLNVEKTVK